MSAATSWQNHLVPGDRLVVTFDGDPGWAHERLIVWERFEPAVDGSLCSTYCVLTAGATSTLKLSLNGLVHKESG